MYNIKVIDGDEKEILEAFGDKYDAADEIELPNALIVDKSELSPVMLSSKLLFAITKAGDDDTSGLPDDLCSYSGIAIFHAGTDEETISATRDFIENGNIRSCVNFPDVDLGPFGDDVSRVAVSMHGIEEPILMAYMMFNSLDIRAVAGGVKGEYGYALVAARKPVVSVPKVDGVTKVRVLQDI